MSTWRQILYVQVQVQVLHLWVVVVVVVMLVSERRSRTSVFRSQ